MIESRICPVCKEENVQLIYEQNFLNVIGINLERFEQNVVICKDCGMIYVTPFLDDNDLQKYYSFMSAYEYNHNENEFSDEDKRKSKRQYDYCLNFINNEVKILDIGCSVGYTLSLFKESGFDVLGIEPSEKNKLIAKKLYGVDVQTDFLSEKSFISNKFDFIILSHVVEHLLNPREILSYIHNILNDNGLIFIETPDINYFNKEDLYQFSFEHINYFNLETTENMMKSEGFELIDSIIFKNDATVSPFYPTLGSIWRKSRKKKDVNLINVYERNFECINKYIDLIKRFNNNLNEKILNFLKEDTNIAIWGAGTLTSQLLAQTILSKYNISNIFDVDEKKNSMKILDINVETPILEESYFLEKNIDIIIIGSWSSQEEIYNSLHFLQKKGIRVIKLFDKGEDDF